MWKLPLIAIVENNRYGMGTAVERVSAVSDVYRKASAFDIPGERIDGNDVLAVRDAVRRMADRARAGGGPQLIEAMTYRFRGHSMGDPQRYRTKEEVEEAKSRDPILRWERAVLENDLATEDELRKIVDEVDAEVEEAVRFAENSPAPDPGEIGQRRARSGVGAAMAQKTYRDAIREALREEMLRDENVLILGEEVGVWGGTYAVTRGLYGEFGDQRILDTPIAEEAIVGTAVGAAMGGLRPVAELMTINFSLVAMDQIVNNAAKIHAMFGGQAKVPLVIRTAGRMGAARRRRTRRASKPGSPTCPACSS